MYTQPAHIRRPDTFPAIGWSVVFLKSVAVLVLSCSGHRLHQEQCGGIQKRSRGAVNEKTEGRIIPSGAFRSLGRSLQKSLEIGGTLSDGC